MCEAIFGDEPIEFYSNQMRKYYQKPQIKLFLAKKKIYDKLNPKSCRETINIGTKTMVIPNSFEVEKWARDTV